MKDEILKNKFRIEDHIQWVVNANHIVILDGKSKSKFTIHYPEAAIWDLLTRTSDLTMIIEKMSIITKSMGMNQVEEETVKTIRSWQTQKLIKKI